MKKQKQEIIKGNEDISQRLKDYKDLRDFAGD